MATSTFDLQQGSSMSNLVTKMRSPSRVRLILGTLLLVFVVLTVVFIVLYAHEKSDNGNSDDGSAQRNSKDMSKQNDTSRQNRTSHGNKTVSPCEDPSCVISGGEILQKLDTAVKPCDDFYQYCCGGFVEKRSIADDQKTLNSFNYVGEKVMNHIRDLLEDDALKKNYSKFSSSAVSKAFNFYSSCMNVSQIENAAQVPLTELIKRYGSSPMLNKNWTDDGWNLERTLGRVFGDLGIGVFVQLAISPSLFNTSHRSLGVGGGVSGLGEKFSQPVDAEQQRRRLLGYLTFMKTVFRLLGVDQTVLESRTVTLFQLESSFLAMKGNLLQQAVVKGYDKAIPEMTIAELNNYTDYKFNWTLYINEILSVAGKSVDEDEKLFVTLPDSLKKIVNLMNSTSKSDLADEIMWNIVKGMTVALPKDFREAASELQKVLSGVETATPRWKTCATQTNTYFEYAISLLYANRYLSEQARQRADDLFTEIRKEFIEGLEEQEWMDKPTRDQARMKLITMKQSVGYPAFIKDKMKLDKMYDTFVADPSDLFENVLRNKKAFIVAKINELEKSPDDSKFPQPPVGVNAFYNPQTNKITVLTGMLKEPFYGSDRLKALNYGGLGMVVGHEISHGFDVSGSQFDEKGNLRSWWSRQSFMNYQKRSHCMAVQYNNTYVYGRKLDGLKTLSENIADNGGLKYAYRAYKKWSERNGAEKRLPGLDFTNDQLFFVGFAQTWCAKYREEYITVLLQRDTHSLNPARVRVPISNFPEFSKAFSCEPPKDTCTVW